jgi:oxygen-independent coproporphyrinogen III oxidase
VSSFASGSAAGSEAYAGPVRHVYVHVPFCRAKCDYCDFASQAVGEQPDEALLEQFVEGVADEWEHERETHGMRRLRTLYIGGGTPSLLGPGRLERVLELFRPFLTPAAEVTVETNPEDVDGGYAAWAARSGVRVSLGVQSFQTTLRTTLGRRAAADPAAAFVQLRQAGVANLGVDLIFGTPRQTEADLEDDVAAVLRLLPDHISWYELGVAPGTALAMGPPAAGLLPDDDTRAAMYRRIVRVLSRNGYDWYEVSNFARAGARARHNVAYWRARSYVGLGPGAVSTVGGRRWTNVAKTPAWAEALAAGAAPPRRNERLSSATRARERLLLAARCGAAVPLDELGTTVDGAAAATLAASGLVRLHGGTIRVTRKGRYVAGEVCVRLFRD